MKIIVFAINTSEQKYYLRKEPLVLNFVLNANHANKLTKTKTKTLLLIPTQLNGMN